MKHKSDLVAACCWGLISSPAWVYSSYLQTTVLKNAFLGMLFLVLGLGTLALGASYMYRWLDENKKGD